MLAFLCQLKIGVTEGGVDGVDVFWSGVAGAHGAAPYSEQ